MKQDFKMKQKGDFFAEAQAQSNALLEKQKKRLSISNSNLDDPAQLNALYIQCREQVLSGEHPVSRETAVRLAAVQSFIEHGPYVSGVEILIKAVNLLPKEYARAKEHEKNIIQEYKDMVTIDIPAAKKKYCKLCTSLPTYGVTFFVVKERESPTEKRLVTRLFGVSKDCVMRIDQKTKTVLKSWPLEQLRRWAASPTTFNIDFGDYVDRYYSAQTFEGEVIKKLIAEYVDIILKKRQFGDPLGIEGDEAGVMLEELAPTGRALPFLVENGRLRWRDEMRGASLVVGRNTPSSEAFDRSDIISSPSKPPAMVTSRSPLQNEPLIVPIPSQPSTFNYNQQFVPIQQFNSIPNHQIFSSQQQIGTLIAEPQNSQPRNLHSLQETMDKIQQKNLQFEKLKQMASRISGDDKNSSLPSGEFMEQRNHESAISQPINEQNILSSRFIKIANDVPMDLDFHAVSDSRSFQNVRQITNQQTSFNQSSDNDNEIQQKPNIKNIPIKSVPSETFPNQNLQNSASASTVKETYLTNITYPQKQIKNTTVCATVSTTNHENETRPDDATQLQPETIVNAVESNIRTEEEALFWLTVESIIELLDLPEMVASGPDAGTHLNWLIVVGTHAVSQHLGTFVVVIAQILDSTSPYVSQPLPSEATIARYIASAGITLADLVACVRELAALLWRVSEPVARKLLAKMHKLCEVFRIFMEQLHPASCVKRAAVLSVASLLGETTCSLLSTTSRDETENVDDNAQAFYDVLNDRIQNIASSTANVVLLAKTFLSKATQQGKLFHCATQVAFTASELIALSRVLASVLAVHSTSQQRIAESVQRVANTINDMVVDASAHYAAQITPEQRKQYDQLLSTANFANNALYQFLSEIHKTNVKKSNN